MTPASSNRHLPDDPISTLPFVGPAYEERLEKLGIRTIRDLMFHFPFRYEDTRDMLSLAEIKQKGEGTTEALVRVIGNTRTRRGMFLTKAVLEDATGTLNAIWFNQPYLTKTLKKDTRYIFNGKVNDKYGSKTLTSPKYELSAEREEDLTHLGKLTPVYPETFGLSSKWIRARLKPLKSKIPELVPDHIPKRIREEEGLPELSAAVAAIHFPESAEDIYMARERLGLDELIAIRRKAQKIIRQQKKKKGRRIENASDSPSKKKLAGSLNFELTSAQKTALAEILEDLTEIHPMYRLLNGDVGSGKTIVALLSACGVYDNGYSTIIMAPTTILAQQHYDSMTTLLKNGKIDIPVTLLTSGEKGDIPAEPGIIIGTHAIIYQAGLPSNIGLIVIDEQHRFGVVQRKKLMKMAETDDGTSPHYLTMTATPIPRTLTMALYGSTNVSVLDELPQGRKPVKTHVVPKKKRDDAYDWIRDRIGTGEQAFIICPLVEESELVDATSVKDEHSRLSKEVFPDHSLGLVHGQLKEQEKNTVLDDFRSKKYDILVATPVIEVGIDIPNATIMIIEDAERFGLAQLHQLRGRIGRGEKESFCFLFTDSYSEEAQERLHYFSTHSSGFDVAEYDLKHRGPGEVYGTRQSGLLDLQFADISDPKQFKKAERIAKKLENTVS
jgi:ATP-dependent DNA helicase RecG